jgi:ribosomal protein S17
MKFKAKFERIPNKAIEFTNDPFQLDLIKKEDEFKLVRSLNKSTYGFVDTIELNDCFTSVKIEWGFYVSKSAQIKKDHRKLIIHDFAEFSYHENMLVEIEKSLFHPEYQRDEKCHRISFCLEFNSSFRPKKLLEFSPIN